MQGLGIRDEGLGAPSGPASPSPRGLRTAPGRSFVLVAEVLVGLATDSTVYSSRWDEALKVNKLTFIIRAFDSSWHPGLPGCLLDERLHHPVALEQHLIEVECLDLIPASIHHEYDSSPGHWSR